MTNVEYHYQGLELSGAYKNYGITPEELELFNDNVIKIEEMH